MSTEPRRSRRTASARPSRESSSVSDFSGGDVTERFNPVFEAPAALWAVVNVIIGGLSGWVYPEWYSALYMPLGFGLLMALLAVADRRRLIVKFGGGEALWRQVPFMVRVRFTARMFGIRLAIVLIPGIVAALAAWAMQPERYTG